MGLRNPFWRTAEKRKEEKELCLRVSFSSITNVVCRHVLWCSVVLLLQINSAVYVLKTSYENCEVSLAFWCST